MPYAVCIHGAGFIGAGITEEDAILDAKTKTNNAAMERFIICECTDEAFSVIQEEGIYAELWFSNNIACTYSEWWEANSS
jgi:hypothetical protein